MHFGDARETLLAAVELNGQPLDCASLGRRLAVSSREARRRIGALEENGLILLLPSFGEGKKAKRLKRPKLYLRDVEQTRRLSPEVVRKLREPHGSLIERIMTRERSWHEKSRFYHYTDGSGYGVDLIIERGEYRFGIVFNLLDNFRRSIHRPLRCAVKEGAILRGFALHTDFQAFFAGRCVLAIPFSAFLAAYEHWSEETYGNNDLRILLRWINSARLIDIPAPR